MKKTVKLKSIFALMAAAAFASCVFAGCAEKSEEYESSKSVSTIQSSADNASEELSSNASQEYDSSKESSKESSTELDQSSFEVDNSTTESVDENSDEEFIKPVSIEDATCYAKSLDDFEITYHIADREVTNTFRKDRYYYIYKITDSKIYFVYGNKAYPVDSSIFEILPEDFVQDFSTQIWEF